MADDTMALSDSLALRIAKGLLCLFAMSALSMGVGYLTSANRAAERRQSGAATESASLSAGQAAVLSRPFAQGKLPTNPASPSPLEGAVAPFSRFANLGSIENGKLNGTPYEVYSLQVEGTPDKVIESYRRKWGYRGFRATGRGDATRGELVGVRKNTGKILRVAARRIEGPEERTEVNFTAYGPDRHVGGFYPQRLPSPLWGEGLRVTESDSNGIKLTHVTWGSSRSNRKIKFYLLKEMDQKGWKPYLGMPDSLPQVEDHQFYDDRGGECAVLIKPGVRQGTSIVEMTAMWPI